jgi:hypothetical protein
VFLISHPQTLNSYHAPILTRFKLVVAQKTNLCILLGVMYDYEGDLVIKQRPGHAFFQGLVMVIIMRNLYVPGARVRRVYEFYKITGYVLGLGSWVISKFTIA